MTLRLDAFCLGCAYPLQGLPQPRCPECGREFDPQDPTTFSANPSPLLRRLASAPRLLITPWFVVPLLWFYLAVPICTPIWLWASLAVVVNLMKHRWISVVAILAFSPMAYFVAQASVDYTNGSGRLRFHGLPSTESFNIDRDSRCERSGGGCRTYGDEWLTEDVHNATLRLLISTFGPMSGAYTGVYPTRQDCLDALASAQPIALADLLQDKLLVAQRPVRVDRGVGAQLIVRTEWEWAAGDGSAAELEQRIGPITAAWYGACVILRVPRARCLDSNGRLSAMVVAIDSVAGRPFAYYSEGGYYHNFPPVPWRP